MSMRRITVAFITALVLASPAQAELLRVEIKTLGMD
jgi:hypothetical protein